jgi:hypothetical protein
VPYYLNFTLATNQNPGVSDPSQVGNITPITVNDSSDIGDSTTKFINDKESSFATIIKPKSMDPSFYKSSTDTISQEIRDFLSKPVIIQQGTFTTTDTFSTFPELLMPTTFNTSPVIKDKLSGYAGFRATTVLRLVVNANRFQQGRYNLQFLYTGGGSTQNSNLARRNTALQNTLVQRSQLPHVELDLCCDTEAVLRIPYNALPNYTSYRGFNTTATFSNVGYAKIYPYSPLAAVSGPTTCGFTLWAYMEDVELISAAIPQSGRAFSSKVKTKSESEKEQVSVGMGPVTSALVQIRDASSFLSKIPLISTYASTTSWFADILSNATNVFGWAKPINLEHSMRMNQNYLPYSANVDGPDNSFPLSYKTTAAVGSAAGFSGTDIDEMDFSFLCTIPSYHSTLSWDVSTATGAVLFVKDVSPFGLTVTRVVGTTTVYDYAPYQFVASFFGKWRGSFVIKLKLVKTEFHSGRLVVSFSPNDTNIIAPPAVTLTNTAYLHRQIIDIRETNEFTFVIPYVSNAPYRNAIVNGISAIGNINIHVLDPLVAPATVTQSIGIIVETCMGADAEFAGPINNTFQPVFGLNPQSGEPFSTSTDDNVCQNFNSSIGSSSIVQSHTNALFCIGEKVSSLRSLIRLPSQLRPSVAPTATLYLNMNPFCNPYVSINSGGTTITPPTFLTDIYGMIQHCYLYSRGGVRLKFIDNTAVTAADPFIVYVKTTRGNINSNVEFNGIVYDGATDSTGATLADGRFGVPSMFYKPGYSGEVQIPQYCNYHSRLVTDNVNHTIGASYLDANESLSSGCVITRTTVPPTATVASVYRAGADDANFGMFLAVPPMISFP